MIKVLIADDSAFMRLAIEKMLSRDSDFEVIGFCSNGEEVIEKLKTLKPDVLTLDIEMPRMNGLEVLDLIMSTNPIPIVMVSSLTTEGAEETIKALELGAIDVVAKPNSYVSLKITDIYDELALKLKSASKARVLKKIPLKTSGSNLRFLRERIRVKAEEIAKEVKIKDYVPITKVVGSLDHKKEHFIEKERTNFKPEVIVLGISTGGPASLQKLIPILIKDLPCGMVVA